MQTFTEKERELTATFDYVTQPCTNADADLLTLQAVEIFNL